jgi:hypothetical protein
VNVTIHTLEKLIEEYKNIKIIKTTPEDDVRRKIDLGLRKQIAENRFLDFVIQIKSSAEGLGVLHAEELAYRQNFDSENRADKTAKIKDDFYTGIKNQSLRTGIATEGLLVKVDGSRDGRIDEVTGVPNDDYTNQQCDGEFGQVTKKVLGLDTNKLGNIATINFDQ